MTTLFPWVSLTCELLDCDTVQDLEARVQFQGLAAALAYEAHLHGAARRFRPFHPCGSGEKAMLGRIAPLNLRHAAITCHGGGGEGKKSWPELFTLRVVGYQPNLLPGQPWQRQSGRHDQRRGCNRGVRVPKLFLLRSKFSPPQRSSPQDPGSCTQDRSTAGARWPRGARPPELPSPSLQLLPGPPAEDFRPRQDMTSRRQQPPGGQSRSRVCRAGCGAQRLSQEKQLASRGVRRSRGKGNH